MKLETDVARASQQTIAFSDEIQQVDIVVCEQTPIPNQVPVGERRIASLSDLSSFHGRPIPAVSFSDISYRHR